MDKEEKKEKKIRWVERVDNKLQTLIDTQALCREDFREQVKKAEKRELKHEDRFDGIENKIGGLKGAVLGWYVFLLFIGGLVAWLFKIVSGSGK